MMKKMGKYYLSLHSILTKLLLAALVGLFVFLLLRYVENIITLVRNLASIDISYLWSLKLNNLYDHRYSYSINSFVIALILFHLTIIKQALLRVYHYDAFMKKAIFYFILFIIVIAVFEAILNFGGFLYYYIHSNIGNPEIDKESFRILFIGESTVAGKHVPKEDRYPEMVEKLLREHYPNIKINCYNQGIAAIESTAIAQLLSKYD